MGDTALTKREATIQRLEGRLRSMRERADDAAGRVQRVATGAGSAFLFGAWVKSSATSGTAVPSIAGLPPLLVWAIGGYVAGEVMGGRAGEVAQDASVGLLDAYAYRLGSE